MDVEMKTYFTDVCCVVRRASRISPISHYQKHLFDQSSLQLVRHWAGTSVDQALGGPQQLVLHLAESVPALGLYGPQLPAAEPCLPAINLYNVDMSDLPRHSTVDM